MNETDIDYIITRVSDIPGTYHKLFAEVPKAGQDMIHSFTIRRSVEVIRTFAVRPPALSSLPVDTHASFRHTHTLHHRILVETAVVAFSVHRRAVPVSSVTSYLYSISYVVVLLRSTTVQYVRIEWQVH